MYEHSSHENGQTMVEFALILTILLALVAGLIDVGRAFFQYNALAAAARDGARWGSVVGGTCLVPQSQSDSDFCNQFGNASGTNFWGQNGNIPLQGAGVACPPYSSTPGDYYNVSDYADSKNTTIVGAVAHRFDSNASTPGAGRGQSTPGFDLSALHVCVSVSNTDPPVQGDTIRVVLQTRFQPVSGLLVGGSLNLSASSQYQVE